MKKFSATGRVRAIAILLAICIILIFPVTSYADMGPKPSVHVTIENLPKESGETSGEAADNASEDLSGAAFYATLLGNTESYGPYSMVDIDSGVYAPDDSADSATIDPERAAFNAFCAYNGVDDFYFWGNVFDASGGGFTWGYYPPQTFRILVYDSASGKVYASGSCSRFAFDSYYSAKLEDDGTISVTEKPYLRPNIISFCVRLVLTILIELLIAWVFGYRGKREIRLIIVVNLITQGILNLAMSLFDYSAGMLTWMFLFPVMELVVVIIEAIAFAVGLKSHTKKRAVGYALIANLVTAFVGFMVGVWIR